MDVSEPPAPDRRLPEMPKQPNYSQYVDHPRYGKSPRYTDVDPDRNDWNVHVHPNTGIMSDAVIAHLRHTWGGWPPSWFPTERPIPVPGTAIEADTSRQVFCPVAVTHYYDLDVVCVGCQRHFIFFADEQKFWYEELQFDLGSIAVRCCECRQQERWIANQKKQYEALCRVADRTSEESLQIAECCLTLMEQGIFHPRQTDHIRQFLNSVPEEQRDTERYLGLRSRLRSFELSDGTKPAES